MSASSQDNNWELLCQYDYRFASLVTQAFHGGKTSPVFHMRLASILGKLPAHEIRACLEEAEHAPPPSDNDIEPIRRRVLDETNWHGKLVLDIGGYDGFAAKIALDKDAARAICLDNHQYEHYGWEEKKLDGVEYAEGDFMACHFNSDGNLGSEAYPALPWPDIIINYNVLYHIKNPWAFLDKCRDVIKPNGEMLLCTLFRYHDGAWMYVYEPRECNPDDESVFWGPSLKAIERLLTFTGLTFKQEGWAADRVVYRCYPTLEPQWRHSKW